MHLDFDEYRALAASARAAARWKALAKRLRERLAVAGEWLREADQIDEARKAALERARRELDLANTALAFERVTVAEQRLEIYQLKKGRTP